MLLFRGRILLFILFACSLPQFVTGSTEDTISRIHDSIEVLSFKQAQFPFHTVYIAPDTSLNGLQRYFVKNSLGNPGSAITPLFLPTGNKETGFNYWLDPFDRYLLNKSNIDHFKTKGPYTNFYLASGTKEEQYFKGLHTQNVNSRLNFATGFQRLRSGGDYLRQANTHTNAFISSNYSSRRNRYFLIGSLAYNNLKAQENGGLQSDIAFENSGFGDKKVLGVNLSSAQRRIWNKAAQVSQYFGYGSRTESDSTARPAGYIKHSFLAEDNSITYRDDDPDAMFYPAILRDSLQTHDSVYYYKIENELGWCFNGAKKTSPLLEIDIKHQFARVEQNEIDSTIVNFIGKALVTTEFKGLKLLIYADNCFAGDNKGDLSTKAEIKKILKDSSAYFLLTGNYSSQTPSFLENRYSSNHFEWRYDWMKTGITSANLSFAWNKYDLAVGTTMVQYNFPIYFDNYARPKQYEGTITALSAFVQKGFHVGYWTFENKVTYQSIPDSTIIRLPEFVSDHSIYYENKLFKKALLLRAGIDVFYTTAYMANAYMPATSQFYLQNETRIGNYPYIDVFVNFKIRTVRAFLKYEHANAGLLGNRYYMAPHHPMADGSFVFGLSWDFYD